MSGFHFPKSRLSGIVITTFLVIIFSLILYLFVVVKNNENSLVERGFRNLHQQALNIGNRINNYKDIAANDKDKTLTKIDIDSILYKTPITDPTQEISLYKDTSKLPQVVVSKKTLFKGILKDEYFYGFLVINDSNLLYNSINNDLRISDFKGFLNTWYSTVKPKSSLFKDSEENPLNANQYFKSGFTTDINLSNREYKLFIYPVLPAPIDGEDMYVCGLVPSKDFQKNKRTVQTWVVVMFSLIFLFILITFPIIKLFIINTIERINRINLYYAGASLIFGTAIIVIISLNVLSAAYLHKNSQTRIQQLNHQIKDSLITELQQAYALLQYLDTNDSLKQSKSSALDCQLMQIDSLPYNCGMESIKLPTYKFFKTAFWVDSAQYGDQLLEFKTWKDKPNLVNLKMRDYIKSYNEWLFPRSKENSCTFRFQSIYSNTNGDALLAISMEAQKKDIDSNQYSITGHRDSRIMALTAPMASIIETVVPAGFEFRIIDETGKVWFHSNKNKNLQENLFLESNNNSDLIASMQSRVEHHFKLKLYNQKNYAYITPIDNLPLFLITTENMNANVHQNAQITLSLLGYLSIIFALGVLFVIILILIASEKTALHYRSFVLDWILPRPKNNNTYIVLTFLNLVQILLLAGYLLYPQSTQHLPIKNVLVFCISVFVINIIVAFNLLKIHANSLEKFLKTNLLSIPALLLLILNLYALFRLGDYEGPFISLLGIITLISILFRFKNIKRLLIHFKIKGYLDTYRSFIFSWLMLFSVLIPLLLYKSFFIETSQIKLKHQQKQFAEALVSKFKSADDYFKLHYKASTEEEKVKEARKMHGNYLDVYQNTRFLKATPCADTNNKCQAPNWLSVFYYKLDQLFAFNTGEQPELNRYKAADSLWQWSILNKNELLFKFQLPEKGMNASKIYQTATLCSSIPKVSSLDVSNH